MAMSRVVVAVFALLLAAPGCLWQNGVTTILSAHEPCHHDARSAAASSHADCALVQGEQAFLLHGIFFAHNGCAAARVGSCAANGLAKCSWLRMLHGIDHIFKLVVRQMLQALRTTATWQEMQSCS